MLDAEALADLTADMVRIHVSKSLAPLLDENGRLRERVAVLEARSETAMSRETIGSIVAEEIAKAVIAISTTKETEETDSASIARMISDAVADIPQPKDGTSVTSDDIVPIVDRAVAKAVAEAVSAIPAAKDGMDADPDRVLQMVMQAVAAIPAPKDGTSVTVDDVLPLIDGAIAKAVSAIPAAKDGVGLSGALIDRTGNLVITLTDGGTRELGQVVGRDVDPGQVAAMVQEALAALPNPIDGAPGADADPDLIAQMVADAMAQIPVPMDGKDGKDGKDGTAGKDAYPGEARGLFDGAAVYRALDVVSFNGSEWRAKRDGPGELPGDGWMLSACRGKKGEPGKGIPGANLVAAYVEQDTATLVMTRDDGIEIKADLSGLIPTT